MMFRTGRLLIPALLLSGLAAVGAATASPAEQPAPHKLEYRKVKDEAGFFGHDTLDKVNALVKQIKEEYGKDFFVETFPAVGPEHAREVKGMTQAARDRFFQQWAEERAKIADVDGIYVLICKEPPHCSILVSPDLANRFRAAELAQLEKLLPPRGMTFTYDKRFVEAAKYVEQVLAAPPPAAGASTPWVLIWFTVGLLGLVGVLMLIRAAASRPASHPDGAPAGGKTIPTHHSGIISAVGGPIGTAGGHTLPRSRAEDAPAPDSLADTQPFSHPEESGRGEEVP